MYVFHIAHQAYRVTAYLACYHGYMLMTTTTMMMMMMKDISKGTHR